MQPDAIDWKIINILSQEYIPNGAVAKKLALWENSEIRQRLKKLGRAGVLRIKALCDPNVLENQQLAVVATNVAQAKALDAKAREISKLKNVQAVSIVSGRYDLFIEVLVDSNKGLIRFLTEDLAKIDGISKTETFVTLKSYRKFI